MQLFLPIFLCLYFSENSYKNIFVAHNVHYHNQCKGRNQHQKEKIQARKPILLKKVQFIHTWGKSWASTSIFSTLTLKSFCWILGGDIDYLQSFNIQNLFFTFKKLIIKRIRNRGKQSQSKSVLSLIKYNEASEFISTGSENDNHIV